MILCLKCYRPGKIVINYHYKNFIKTQFMSHVSNRSLAKPFKYPFDPDYMLPLESALENHFIILTILT